MSAAERDDKPDRAPAVAVPPLRERDSLFRILVQGVTDYAIFMLDPAGLIATWNPGAERLKGYRADEIIGRHFSRFYTEEDRAAKVPDRALATAAETGRFESEGWRVRQDGSQFWASVVIDAIRDDDGALVGFAKVTRDITERLLAQTALRNSEERFRLLVQSVTDYAIYMLDLDGRVSNWNAGAERIKGYAADEIVGQHFSRFYTEEERESGMPSRALETAAREGRFEREGWRVRKDGSRFWANVVIDPIYDPAGRHIGYAKITRDMTERKRTEDALEEARAALLQAQKMEAVGQLTRGIAHDFNNLLTVITNGLDLLLTPPSDEAQRLRLIGSAQRAAERGAELTQQLLAFARQQPLRPRIQDVNAVVAGFEAVLRRASADTVEFELALSRRPLAANIDTPQFETALLNIVINARDAMPQGGRLRISTSVEAVDAARAQTMAGIAPGDYAVIAIADTGEGMSPETAGRAFEPFFTTKDVGKGSGLGLSQVYGFVTQSGGHVAIESRLPRGTTIKLYLPTARTLPAATPEAAKQPGRPSEAGRILVVEDDPEVLDVAVQMLRNLGYDVSTAADGPSALEMLRRDDAVDILFSDIVMPRGMNGVELARAAVVLRPQLRVLLASGYPMTALSADHGLSGGDAFAFLTKPYRRAALIAKLKELQES